MTKKMHGRRKPYTHRGIKRIPCARCGLPSESQWQICADKRVYRPVCRRCDIELNEMVLKWMGVPNAEAVLNEYIAKKNRQE